jgi:hypothetical protein
MSGPWKFPLTAFFDHIAYLKNKKRILIQLLQHLLIRYFVLHKRSFAKIKNYYVKELKLEKVKLHGLSPRGNHIDRATAVCRRSWCQRLRKDGVEWSAQRIPTAAFSDY